MNALDLILGLYGGILTIIVGLLLWAFKNFIASTNNNFDDLKKEIAQLNTKMEVSNQNMKNGYQQILLHDKRITSLEQDTINIKERLIKLENKQ